MANGDENKIVYEFEDLRRNDDPLPDHIAGRFGMDEEEEEKEEKREAKRKNGKDKDEDSDHRKELLAERRKRQRLERELEEARDEAGETISGLTKRLDKLEKRGETSNLDTEYKDKVADYRQRIEDAIEQGKSDVAANLTVELSEYTADNRVKRARLEAEATGGDGDDDTETRRTQQRPPRRVRDWMEEQDEWFNDPDHKHIRSYAARVETRLREDGYKLDEDEFYEKLEAKLEERYPGVIKRTIEVDDGENDDDENDDETDVETRQRQRKAASRNSPVRDGGPSGKGGDTDKRPRRGERKLTTQDQQNMRVFGMDPNNQAECESYMEGKY